MDITATPVIRAEGLSLRTGRGPVFGPIDLEVRCGEYVVCCGEADSGKTALLLTLTGRMRPSGGTLTVAGIDARRHAAAVRRRCALAVFAGLNDLPGALSVRDAIKSESLLWPSGDRRARIEVIAAGVGLENVLDRAVDDLTELQRRALGVGLALVARPAVMAVDDIGVGLTCAEQDEFDLLLRTVASDGVAVVGSCTDAQAVVRADRVVSLCPSTESEAVRALA